MSELNQQTEALALTVLEAAISIIGNCSSEYHYCQGCFNDGMRIIQTVVNFLDAEKV